MSKLRGAYSRRLLWVFVLMASLGTACGAGKGPEPSALPDAVQEVNIEVTHARSEVPTYTQFEIPYNYTVTIDPWLFAVSDENRNPVSVRWTSKHRFELHFSANHFEAAHEKSERRPDMGHWTHLIQAEQKEGVWIAESGPLTSKSFIHDRYRYAIKIWPKKPGAKTFEQSQADQKAHGGKLVDHDPEKRVKNDEYVIVVDPDYVIED